MPTVALIGQSAVAYAGNLRIFSSDWHSFYFEQHQIVDSSATALQALTGQSSNAAYGEIAESGAGIYGISGIDSISSLGLAVISGTENVSVIVNGVSAESAYGAIVATGEVSLDAQISIVGITASSSLSSVSVNVLNPETWSSGKIKRYPANQFVSATAKTASVSAKFEIGEIQTNATTVINATISLNNVVSFVQASDINASGTLEISDEELILLLAA